MANLTLSAYQEAELAIANEEGRRGFNVHALITAVVCVGLVVLNLTVADEFPWSIFPVVGMSIGLFMHWHFGVAGAAELTRRHQTEIEAA
jgi:hypothetical protein